MPGKYVVTNGGKLVVERFTGVLAHAEIVAHEREKLQDSSIARGTKVLSDVRSAVFRGTTLDLVHEIADVYGDPDNRTSIATYAVVCSSQGFDAVKLWEAQARQQGVNAIVFNNLEVACIWLGVDLLKVQELLDNLDL